MQDTCHFCPFVSDSMFSLLQHIEAEHTRGVDTRRPPTCSCRFVPEDWEDLRIHLWKRHGGGLAKRPAEVPRLSQEDLVIYIQSSMIPKAAQPSSVPAMVPPPTVRTSYASPSSAYEQKPNSATKISPVATRGSVSQPPPHNYSSPWENYATASPPEKQPQSFSPPQGSPPELVSYPTVNGKMDWSTLTTGSSVEQPEVAPINGNSKYKRYRKLSESECPEKRLKFSCEMCERGFDTQESLRQHKMDSHPFGETLVYNCEECGCQFLIIKAARTHIQEVHGLSDITKHLKTRKVPANELPLKRCKESGCFYRTTFPGLLGHQVHSKFCIELATAAKPSDVWSVTRKRELRAQRERDAAKMNELAAYETEAKAPSDYGSLTPDESHSPKIQEREAQPPEPTQMEHIYAQLLQASRQMERKQTNNNSNENTGNNKKGSQLLEIDCRVENGYIKIPADKLSGKYVMVSADPSKRAAPEFLVNIVNSHHHCDRAPSPVRSRDCAPSPVRSHSPERSQRPTAALSSLVTGENPAIPPGLVQFPPPGFSSIFNLPGTAWLQIPKQEEDSPPPRSSNRELSW